MERASWTRWVSCVLGACLTYGCADVGAVDDEQPGLRKEEEETSSPARATAALVQPPIRVHAGSPYGFWDAAGNLWSGDHYFADGTAVQRGPITITGTNDDYLYQNERFGVTRYSVPVPNGLYTVKLHFAETYEGITGPGQRVFGVRAETMNLGEIDVFARTGGRNRALVLTHHVRVQDGVLDLRFTSIVQNTVINAFEILAPEPADWLRVEAGGSRAYTDSHGGVWQPDFGYEGGVAVDRGNIPIEGELNPRIYQTERFGMSSYEFDVPNGFYMVSFNFVETYDGITGPGQRVFVPEVNGISTWNVDVFGETGGRGRTHTFGLLIEVTNQHIHIGFVPLVQNAMVSGIALRAVPPL
jgi:hypothetical protein